MYGFSIDTTVSQTREDELMGRDKVVIVDNPYQVYAEEGLSEGIRDGTLQYEERLNCLNTYGESDLIRRRKIKVNTE